MLDKLKTLVAITTFSTLLGACSDNTPDLPVYKITEDTVKGNIKRTVEVELSSRTNEDILRGLAEKIYTRSNVDVQRTFIGYRITGGHKNQGYWATTHYNPNLEIKILGENASDYEKIGNTPLPEGELLGTWMANWGYEYKMVAYKKDGETYIRSVFGDGSSSDKTYELSESGKGIRLQDEGGKERGEFFIINPTSDLEFWSENGNYYTAPKS